MGVVTVTDRRISAGIEPEAVVESAVGDAEPSRFAARRLIKRFLL